MKKEDVLKVSPIPYIYKWGKDTVVEFWVKYERSDPSLGFLGMLREKLLGISARPMPTVICEEIDRRVRPLIIYNRWMYFTVSDTEVYVNGKLR
jgi:hypothetical protein